MLNELNVLWMLLFAVAPTAAQTRPGIDASSVSISINLSAYPELVRVPGYPIYYAPRLDSNYFFYDGMYWVYQGDNWYAGSWYNGPWRLVSPDAVPVYVLRVPVRYYRQPPAYFHGWQLNAPPRWGAHWGHEWAQRRSGWDHWQRNSAPAPAPLPVYQRKYSGDHYPRAEQQSALQSQHYRYQPHDAEVRQQHQAQREQGRPATPQKRVPPDQQQNQQSRHEAARPQQPEPRSRGDARGPQGRVAAPEPRRAKDADQERDREKPDERGQDRRK